jgi:hypothetical protein
MEDDVTREQRLFSAAQMFLELAPNGKDIADYESGTCRAKPEYLRSLLHAAEDLREALAAYEGQAVTIRPAHEGRLG